MAWFGGGGFGNMMGGLGDRVGNAMGGLGDRLLGGQGTGNPYTGNSTGGAYGRGSGYSGGNWMPQGYSPASTGRGQQFYHIPGGVQPFGGGQHPTLHPNPGMPSPQPFGNGQPPGAGVMPGGMLRPMPFGNGQPPGAGMMPMRAPGRMVY
jgi:hypothetical protein